LLGRAGLSNDLVREYNVNDDPLIEDQSDEHPRAILPFDDLKVEDLLILSIAG
jgi:hypothetical protein